MKENLALAWSEYCKSLSPAIVAACSTTAPSQGPSAIIKALAARIPEWKFRHVFARGGWYRLGGVVDGDGKRIADNLEAWVEGELDHRDGDIRALIDDYAGQSLYATRLVGQTHYLVAQEGDACDAFIQLEIEDLQEMRAHRLFDNDPGNLEELVDPRGAHEPVTPIGMPFHHFRRVQHIGAFLERMRLQKADPAPIHRMIEDWNKSSAGGTSAYCNHWVIATREHIDRYHQPVFRAQPIATLAGNPPEFEAPAGTAGPKLREALSHFDRAVGYPMAWYFHMLTSKAVPHWVAQIVVEDALSGFAYLPPRDIEVVRGWLHQPYAP